METDILSLYATRPVVARVIVTRTIKTSSTSITLTTTVCERCNNKVTSFYRSNVIANFFDYSDSLMTTISVSLFDFWITVTPEVGTTNAGTDNANNGIIRRLNLRTVNFCQTNLPSFCINCLFHMFTSFSLVTVSIDF